MKICLASISDKPFMQDIKSSRYLLESYYYFQEWEKPLLKTADLFLIDSGAFTFMSGNKNANFAQYLERYSQFLKENQCQYFFELDIDSVVGYPKVREYRDRLEQAVGRPCIPVWHKGRGIDEWYKMTEEYSYVAIGGIVSKEIRREEYPAFKKMISIASANGCKVHGLGFTSCAELPKYHFYSVDSTSWRSGGRFGTLHQFDGKKIVAIKPNGKRAKSYHQIDNYNFSQWVKYQRYADCKL